MCDHSHTVQHSDVLCSWETKPDHSARLPLHSSISHTCMQNPSEHKVNKYGATHRGSALNPVFCCFIFFLKCYQCLANNTLAAWELASFRTLLFIHSSKTQQIHSKPEHWKQAHQLYVPLWNHNDTRRIKVCTFLAPVCFPSMMEKKTNNILVAVSSENTERKFPCYVFLFCSSLSAYTETRAPFFKYIHRKQNC